VTGSERIAWNQSGDVAGLRFLAYVDGNQVALDQATCNASAAECSSPLPAMTDGMHTLAIAAVSRTGDEGSRSAPLTIQKVSARSVINASFAPDAAGSTTAWAAGTLTVASGRTFAVEVVGRSLKSPVQMDATGDGRLLVAEADGRVRVVHLAGGDRPEPAFESRGLVRPEPIGPLGLALHPDFASNRFAYVSFLADDGPNRLILRLVRMREAGDTLGEPATLFEAPLAAAADVPPRAPRMAFGPDRLLYVLLPPGVEFDDERVAGRPHTSMALLDEDGRVAAAGPASGVSSHPLGFGWHALTATLWGIVPQVEGNAAILPLTEGGVSGAFAWRNAPRLAVDASRSDGALVVRQDATADWPRQFAQAFDPASVGTIRLATPILVNGLIDGIAGQVVDVISAGGALYVAVEGFDPPAADTGDPAAVIFRVREEPR
jgi:hypothetical protein